MRKKIAFIIYFMKKNTFLNKQKKIKIMKLNFKIILIKIHNFKILIQKNIIIYKIIRIKHR